LKMVKKNKENVSNDYKDIFNVYLVFHIDFTSEDIEKVLPPRQAKEV